MLVGGHRYVENIFNITKDISISGGYTESCRVPSMVSVSAGAQ